MYSKSTKNILIRVETIIQLKFYKQQILLPLFLYMIVFKGFFENNKLKI